MIFIYFHDRIDFPRPSIPESMSFSLPGDAMAKAAALSAAKDLGGGRVATGGATAVTGNRGLESQEFSSIETLKRIRDGLITIWL